MTPENQLVNVNINRVTGRCWLAQFQSSSPPIWNKPKISFVGWLGLSMQIKKRGHENFGSNHSVTQLKRLRLTSQSHIRIKSSARNQQNPHWHKTSPNLQNSTIPFWFPQLNRQCLETSNLPNSRNNFNLLQQRGSLFLYLQTDFQTLSESYPR